MKTVPQKPLVIDAHHHFWAVKRGDYHWMTPDVPVLYRDYGPEDMLPHLQRHAIAATILVQAAQTIAETRYLLDIAARTPFVAGVVGWVDFASATAVADIRDLAQNSMLVGLRPMVQDIDDDDWLLRRDIGPAIEAMIECKLVFDALVLPRHLPRLSAFLDRYPDLPTVLDHAAKPFIRSGAVEPWRSDMSAIAARPQTFCKISGLVTEADRAWSTDDLRPYVEHLVASFGAERVMWGSDWPVLEVAGGYDTWRQAAGELLSGLAEAEQAMVFGENAARFYLAHRGRQAR